MLIVNFWFGMHLLTVPIKPFTFQLLTKVENLNKSAKELK